MNSEIKERVQRYASGRLPLRQMLLAGSGSGDSAVTFIGLLVGAAFAHNFGIASSPQGRHRGWSDCRRSLHRRVVRHCRC